MKALTAKLASICAPARFARKWVPASGMPTAVMPRAVPIEATALEMAKATGGIRSDLERDRRGGERGDPQAVFARSEHGRAPDHREHLTAVARQHREIAHARL